MDVIPRIQPTDPSALTQVDSGVMRMCATTVLVHSVTVRHLPANVDKLNCAITITVNGSAFTTSTVVAEVEDDETELFADAVVNTVSSATGGSVRDSRSSITKAAAARTFKMSFTQLNLLFPGTRRPAREMGQSSVDGIDNPREFPLGVQVTVHSADGNHVFGSALCKTSGEPASLSYPRGEASLSFRVYPCVDGITMMKPLFNKACFANQYLNAAPAAAAAITEGGEGEGAAVAAAAGDVAEGTATGEAEVAAAPVEAEGVDEAAEQAAPAEEVQAAAEVEQEEEATEAAPAEVDAEEEAETTAAAAALAGDESQAAEAPTEEVAEDAQAEEVQAVQEAEQVEQGEPEASVVEEEGKEVQTPEEVAAPIEEAVQEEEAAAVTTVAVAPVPRSRVSSPEQQFSEALTALIPCYTERQRRAVFDLYQTQSTTPSGALSRKQVLHFIRSHAAYADACEDDEALLRWSLAPYVTNKAEIDATATATPHATDAVEGEAAAPPAQIEDRKESSTTAAAPEEARPETPRVDPGHLYYRPATGSSARRSGRLGQCTPLEINYELFSVIALKLAKA